jgi:hypothetical protein
MKSKISIPLLALSLFPGGLVAQEVPKPNPDSPAPRLEAARSAETSDRDNPHSDDTQSLTPGPSSKPPAHPYASASGVGGKFHYYFTETYCNASALTAPAFRAGIRMSNPPGKGVTAYPNDWRQGTEAFGRNYGDAAAQRFSFPFDEDPKLEA